MSWMFWVALASAVIGFLSCAWLGWSHWHEWHEAERQRRRLEVHSWALEARREELKAASMSPLLFKGYKTYKAEDQ